MSNSPAVLAAIATDVGRVRQHNEDAALADGTLFVVADGMGGHHAGEVASRIAVETMGQLARRSGLQPGDLVRQVEAANRAILMSAAEHPEQTGMATTLVGLAAVTVGGSEHWAVFNIGDSRVYRLIDGQLTQVSADHSEVADLVRLGAITEDEAARHPARNIVTRCLGRDRLEPVDTWVFPRHPGERFLLCSDGLTNELPDDEIAEILGSGGDPRAVADTLVDRAVAAGGHDNVTVVVVVLEAERPSDVDEETTPRQQEHEQAAR
jgi:protein phosphatase